MKSITIHNLDAELARHIEQEARSQGLSLNKTIKNLLSKALGFTHKQIIKNDFSEFVGTMSAQEAERINKALKDFEKIDEEDWQ